MMMKLTDKWAFITGAASGIGYEISLELANKGCNLIITDINQQQLTGLSDKVLKLGRKCLSYQLNVADAEHFSQLANKIAAEVGCPDVIVNNAGVGFMGDVMSNTTQVWQKMFDVNVMGVVNGCQSFLPLMKQANKTCAIVNVASGAARTPNPNMSAYAASKYAVEGFTDVLRMELAETDISVVCVYPGVINTNITQDPKVNGENITESQLKRLRTFYIKNGSHPCIVGQDVVLAIQSGKEYVFTGNGAKIGKWLERFTSKKMLFNILRKNAKKVGYL